MQFQKVGKDYLINIDKDEKVVETLTRFCKENGIKNAKLSGIGAVKKTEIGAYDLQNKEYIKREYSEILELLSLEGNVALKDGEPFIHAHVVLSDHKMQTLGGHLFETTVGVAGEFFLTQFDGNAYRELKPDIGLACMCLETSFE
ncbi:MAG: PPC domain-containing DNA-binding protein [Candidatus Neomarinimicrobiota bacterium]